MEVSITNLMKRPIMLNYVPLPFEPNIGKVLISLSRMVDGPRQLIHIDQA